MLEQFDELLSRLDFIFQNWCRDIAVVFTSHNPSLDPFWFNLQLKPQSVVRPQSNFTAANETAVFKNNWSLILFSIVFDEDQTALLLHHFWRHILYIFFLGVFFPTFPFSWFEEKRHIHLIKRLQIKIKQKKKGSLKIKIKTIPCLK